MRTVIFAAVVSLAFGGVATGQPQTADALSCAFWLQWASTAKKFPGSVAIPSVQAEVQKLADDFVLIGQARGFREGYATGVMALAPLGRRSYIRDSSELVTALDSLCAGTPHKRLIDVALHALGRR